MVAGESHPAQALSGVSFQVTLLTIRFEKSQSVRFIAGVQIEEEAGITCPD